MTKSATTQPAAEKATPSDHLPWRIGGTCGDATWIFDSDSYTQAIIKGERHLDRARLIVRSVNQSAAFDALEKAVRQIAEHPHCSYDHPSNSDSPYGTGCADGHRCAATIATAALAQAAELRGER